MGAILIPLGPWLSVALLLSALPAFFVVVRYAVAQYQWRVRTIEDEQQNGRITTGSDRRATPHRSCGSLASEHIFVQRIRTYVVGLQARAIEFGTSAESWAS